MSRKKSIGLYHRAWEIIPGGVNSPVRAFKAVGVPPTFIERAKGSKIFDVDGNEYIDYVGSWGPMPASTSRITSDAYIRRLRIF